ncbi:DUF2461 domain-containing protein [Anaerocaecibacter muris]|uniref:DUF2461 domain-containing protein n=1 Tax=Anaerocaecibacter muris TaxID=2941513 RepID=UPI00203CCDEF|nr:DUF2461 domain-containing protein [Anaerocaecibacter muris]
MHTQTIMDYLTALAANNDREWYHAHKADYKAANALFEQLVQELIYGIGTFDNSVLHNVPKELTFKLVRDTRFSHDKSPYNPSFRAHISSQGKLPIPVGYYIMLKPNGGTFLGGGLFADMFANATAMVRDYISAHPDEWNDIITDAAFSKYFTVKGTALKNVPAGYDKNNPQAEYLKFKSWYVEYFIPDEDACDGEKLIQTSLEVFKAMKPFNDYLNKALKDFKMPAR